MVPLLVGALLISLQAICIVSTLAIFGDAARVNVVYSLRGLWGVLLAWAVAKKWGGAEAEQTRGTMMSRLAAVILRRCSYLSRFQRLRCNRCLNALSRVVA